MDTNMKELLHLLAIKFDNIFIFKFLIFLGWNMLHAFGQETFRNDFVFASRNLESSRVSMFFEQGSGIQEHKYFIITIINKFTEIRVCLKIGYRANMKKCIWIIPPNRKINKLINRAASFCIIKKILHHELTHTTSGWDINSSSAVIEDIFSRYMSRWYISWSLQSKQITFQCQYTNSAVGGILNNKQQIVYSNFESRTQILNTHGHDKGGGLRRSLRTIRQTFHLLLRQQNV